MALQLLDNLNLLLWQRGKRLETLLNHATAVHLKR